MLTKATRIIFVLAMLSVLPVTASAGVPDWVRSVAQQPAKKYADDANAVLLLDDQETTVRENGEIVTHQRLVYRILRPEGKEYSRCGVWFDQETKIHYLRGWSITAKGLEYEAKDKDSLERSGSAYEVFSDEKEKLIQLPGVEVGTVVAYEYEHKRRPYLFQDMWYFQSTIPVEKSRYTLRIPARWEYRADWSNHASQNPAEQAGAYVWEVSDVPRIEEEHHQPPYRALAGHMIVTFFSDSIKSQTYHSWKELGTWYSQLTTGVRDASPALSAKAMELAPANLPMWDRIRALSRFAQRDVRYVAIEIGIGGYKPHPAAEIFAHRYGDCKDKATVLSSMLSQIGIKSYYMPIHATRGIYTEKSPPNSGFNHVILAIQLPDGSYPQGLPAMVEHPKLGHLLIFDPTNEWVPLGQLPYYEQDSFALLVTDDGGELTHLPITSPDANRVRRIAKLNLLADGSLKGEIEEIFSGFPAMLNREYLDSESQNDRNKKIQHFLGKNQSNLEVDAFNVENVEDINKDLVVRFTFTANHYAKNAGPLLLVRPRVIGEMASAFDGTKPRHYAYEFDAPFLRSDVVEISLPEGYSVDELPNSAKGEFSFAQYKSKTEQAGNVLRYSREYKMQATSVPADKFEDLRRLFSQIIVDEKSMAVLKRKN
jgi:transglutaminase-like putative cysteine protease